MSKSEQKRFERKQKKKKARKQRASLRNIGREGLLCDHDSSVTWPTYELRLIDEVGNKITQAVDTAWIRASKSKVLEGERLKDLRLASEHGFHKSLFGTLHWSITLGQLLYHELQSELEPVTLRRIDVEVHATNREHAHVQINVRALESVLPFVACSPRRPTIRLNDSDFVVAFNLRKDDHFISRLEERTVVVPSNYICKGQVFACLYKWQHFDPLVLPNGQLATRLWNWCDPRTPLGALWIELLGPTARLTDYGSLQFYDSEQGRAYYLVGYCPIDHAGLSKGYAVLRTLLLPGMDNTPEAALLKKVMNTEQRSVFDKHAKKQSMRELSLMRDFSVIRQYHQCQPQVRFISDNVFAESDLTSLLQRQADRNSSA